MLDRLSDAGRRVVASAQFEARRLSHERVGTEHLLLGLLGQPPADGSEALLAMGATLEAARDKVAEAVPASQQPLGPSELPLSARAARALERASRFSLQQREATVGTDQVLLGILDVEGLACQVLRRLGVDPTALRATLTGDRTGSRSDRTESDRTESDRTDTAEVSPRCSSCHAALDGNVRSTRVVARAEDGGSAPVVVSCATCGAALGAHLA